MSVQSTARYAGPFAGNGVTTVFAFAFKVFAASDIVVASTVAATGVVSNPVNGADYTVQLNADQNVNPGGTITYAVAPPATVSPIYITSVIPKAQLSSFPNPGPWNPTTGESAWDKSMTIIQELGQAALLFAPGDVASTHVLPSPANRKNAVLGFDANGALTVAALVGFVLSTAIAGQIAFGSAANTLTQDANLVWDNVNKRQGIGVAVPTVALDVLGTGKFSTSVVAPLVQTQSNANLVLGANSRLDWAIDKTSAAWLPVAASSIGSPTNLVASIFTPIIDSGTTGSLSLKTNNGNEGFRVNHNTGTGLLTVFNGGAGTANLRSDSSGADANVSILYGTKGAGTHQFYTDGLVSSVTQFQVLHTASATRNITVTGSNGGNPTIGVTGGNLAITPNIVLGQAVSKIIPGATSLALRNNADSADNLILTDAGAATLRSNLTVNGTSVVGNGATLGLTSLNGTFTLTSAADIVLSPTTDIKWGRANIALGGGAAPTVGTIGGTGPAAAAQRNWLRFIESDGTASFIPVWR